MMSSGIIPRSAYIAAAAMILFHLVSCTHTPGKDSAKRDLYAFTGALAGTWTSSDGSYHEKWEIRADSLLTGTGFTLEGKDTLFSEKLKIVIDETGESRYLATVPGQNNGLPVAFLLSSASEDFALFENPGHDFPKRIEYRRTSDTSIVVEVGAEGDKRSFSLLMIRQQTISGE